MSKLKTRKNKNKLIGSKYNVAAWEHFGTTKKLKGGFGVDGKEVEGTLKLKGSRKKNNRKMKFKFKEKGELFYKPLTRDSA
tara:strand:+ start:363 stop:605 length:243 start_codon:yes stop_codon:yes gene_type:complete